MACTVSLKDRLLLAEALIQGRIAANLVATSKSGLSRRLKFISVLVSPDERASFLRITHWIAAIAGYQYRREDLTLVVQGCGFDAIYDVLDNLIYRLSQDDELLEELSTLWQCSSCEVSARLEQAKRSIVCI